MTPHTSAATCPSCPALPHALLARAAPCQPSLRQRSDDVTLVIGKHLCLIQAGIRRCLTLTLTLTLTLALTPTLTPIDFVSKNIPNHNPNPNTSHNPHPDPNPSPDPNPNIASSRTLTLPLPLSFILGSLSLAVT